MRMRVMRAQVFETPMNADVTPMNAEELDQRLAKSDLSRPRFADRHAPIFSAFIGVTSAFIGVSKDFRNRQPRSPRTSSMS
jgi:hypothetical protein